MRLDPELRIQYVNHLKPGVTYDQVLGRPIHEVIEPEDVPEFEAAVQRALRTGEPSRYVARGSRAIVKGSKSVYEGQAVSIDNGDGRRAVCMVAMDVSEHLERAEALRASEEKLRIAVEATGIGLFTWDTASDRYDWDQRLIEMVGYQPRDSSDY